MLVFLNLDRQEQVLDPGLFHKIAFVRGALPQTFGERRRSTETGQNLKDLNASF